MYQTLQRLKGDLIVSQVYVGLDALKAFPNEFTIVKVQVKLEVSDIVTFTGSRFSTVFTSFYIHYYEVTFRLIRG